MADHGQRETINPRRPRYVGSTYNTFLALQIFAGPNCFNVNSALRRGQVQYAVGRCGLERHTVAKWGLLREGECRPLQCGKAWDVVKCCVV